MTITALLYRFLKENKIYPQAFALLKYNFYRVDNLDLWLLNNDFNTYILYSRAVSNTREDNDNNISDEIKRVNKDYLNISLSWNNYKTKYDYMLDKEPKTLDITLATELLKEFINIYNIEIPVMTILDNNHNIYELTGNVIDELLYKYSTNIYSLFSSSVTFCSWDRHEYLLQLKGLKWAQINVCWRNFLIDKNIRHIIL